MSMKKIKIHKGYHPEGIPKAFRYHPEGLP